MPSFLHRYGAFYNTNNSAKKKNISEISKAKDPSGLDKISNLIDQVRHDNKEQKLLSAL